MPRTRRPIPLSALTPPRQLEAMSPREREVYQLFVLAEAGVERVRLRAPRALGTPLRCAAAGGHEMSMDDAMRQAPIPHHVAPGLVCGCTYRPAPPAP